MRYGIADRVLQLALDMQASHQGLTLTDIEQRYDVGRRTAQRMRDAVLRLYPQAEEQIDEERRPRWRIPSAGTIARGQFTADEIADLDAAVRVLRRDNQKQRAEAVAGILRKLKASLKPEAARQLEPDIEVLLEAEGLAMRPGPRPLIRAEILDTIRLAIKQGREIYLSYLSRNTRRATGRTLQPYGFLFGSRHYLVGMSPDRHPGEPRMFSLASIQSVRIAERTFRRDSRFSLQRFAERAFGVFQETACDVVWRFLPPAAAAARDFLFHPSQTLEEQADGSLIVRFRAGGLVEMAWHVYTWGGELEVLAPEALKRLCARSRVRIGDAPLVLPRKSGPS